MTSSTLEITPRDNSNRSRGAVSNAEPGHPIYTYTTTGQALARAARDDYPAWLNHVRPAAACTRPVRLSGVIDTIDLATGARLARLHTTDFPDGAIYKACGNRRALVCPGCAHTYQRDAYQLLRAGLVGGKGVPDTVSRHPAIFATFTAPGFGTVHTRHVKDHTCTNRRRCDCRPEPCHARRDTGSCHHGNPAVCWARHQPDDPRLGQPFCLDCYDHHHQVVWNHFAGELWRRTKQAIERHLAIVARRRGIPRVLVETASGNIRWVPPVRVSHGKAAEFQTRGAVHFHALLRLDGVDPTDPTAVVPPPARITGQDLHDAIAYAAVHVGFHTPTHPDQPVGWHITWGEQTDIRPITLTGRGDVTDEMVAGYLAKYATKSTEVTGHTSARLTNETFDIYANPTGTHTERLVAACWRLAQPTQRDDEDSSDTYVSSPVSRKPYAGLYRWAHMLGFGGHFLTKARRYSVTFQFLRDTRIVFRRNEDQDQADATIRTAEHTDTETTLIVGTLSYAGVGWHTTGDALLANTAAAMARERHRIGREELAHEIGSAVVAGPVLVAA
jgi:hypothetical protein